MGFITPIASTSRAGENTTSESSRSSSRRDFLRVIASGALVAFLPESTHAQDTALPPGAAQFSRLIAAQRQWSELRAVLERGDVSDEDWKNLRGYLRSVYAVSGDMEFTAKPWEKGLRDKGMAIASQFRTTVKGMDKPALKKDVEEFKMMQQQVEGIFTEFFELFRQATVSDIPDEL